MIQDSHQIKKCLEEITRYQNVNHKEVKFAVKHHIELKNISYIYSSIFPAYF